jgi:hypothetical protein
MFSFSMVEIRYISDGSIASQLGRLHQNARN